MRLTTRLARPQTLAPLFPSLALGLLVAGCVPQVGGDDGGRTTTDRPCTSPKEVTQDITIRSDADFDQVPSGCWDLYGTLTLDGSGITSLAGLNKLVGIDHLVISDTELTELDSEKPLHVYGTLTVSGNDKLASLDNLEIEHADNLATTVTIEDNSLLASLGDFDALQKIDGDLAVTGNPRLASLELDKLLEVDGAIKISDNATLGAVSFDKLAVVNRVEVTSNPKLATFGGFDATSIGGDVIFRANAALTTLGTMSSLSSIAGNLTIDDNDALTTVGMFTSSTQYLAGKLTLIDNAQLSDLGELSHLSAIGSIEIRTNTNLSQCRAEEVDRCVPSHGSSTIASNQSASNCTYWCQ